MAAPTTDGAEAGVVLVSNTGPGFTTTVRAGPHTLVVDEPTGVGGDDAGPTPYDLLLGAIGACTAITVRMYARRKGWPLEDVIVRAKTGGRSHAADCSECVDRKVGPPSIETHVELVGPLTDEQRQRLAYIAGRCPVKQALRNGIDVRDVSQGAVP